MLEGRNFIGIELDKKYYDKAQERLELAEKGLLKYRDIEKPVFDPRKAGAVARDPIIINEKQELAL